MSNFWEKDKPVQADQPPVQKVNFWDKDKPVEQVVPPPVADVAPVAQPQAKGTNLANLVTNNPFSSPPGEKPIPPLLERPEYKNLWPETSYLRTPEPAYTLEMPDGQEVLISIDGKSMTGAVYNKKTNTFDFEYEEKQDPVVPSGVSAGGRGFYSPPTNVTKIKKVSPNEVVGYTNAADKLESAKIAFGRSIIPTASGFTGFAGGAALATAILGAPETFGASLIPLLAGAVTGFGTGMAGQSFQDRMFPLDKAQQLALDSNPKIAGAAGFAPALIAAPTSPRTWMNLASQTPGVAAKAATQLGSNAVMMGALGTGNDVGANLVAGKPALQGVGLGSILHHTGTGLLLGHPNKIGRVMEAPGRFTANAALMPFGKGDFRTPLPGKITSLSDLETAAAEAQAQGQPGTAQPLPRITSEEARTKYPNGYDGEVVWPDGRVTGWSGTVEATVNISPSAPSAPAPATTAQATPPPAARPEGSVPPRPRFDDSYKGRIPEYTADWQAWDAQYGQTHWSDGTPKTGSAAPAPAGTPAAPVAPASTAPVSSTPAQAAPSAPAPKPVVEAPKPTGNLLELGVADLTERIRFIKGELGRRQAEVKAAAEEGITDTEGQGRVERLNKSLAEAEGALERLKDRNAPRSELPPPAVEPTTAEVLAQRKAEFDKLTRQLEAAQRSQRSMKGGDEQIALLEAEHEVASTAYEEALAAHEQAQRNGGNPPPAAPAPKPVAPKPVTPVAPAPVAPAPKPVTQAQPPAPTAKPKKEPAGVTSAREQLAKLEAGGNANSPQAKARRKYIRKWEKDNGLPYSVELEAPKPPKAPTAEQPVASTPVEPVASTSAPAAATAAEAPKAAFDRPKLERISKGLDGVENYRQNQQPRKGAEGRLKNLINQLEAMFPGIVERVTSEDFIKRYDLPSREVLASEPHEMAKALMREVRAKLYPEETAQMDRAMGRDTAEPPKTVEPGEPVANEPVEPVKRTTQEAPANTSEKPYSIPGEGPVTKRRMLEHLVETRGWNESSNTSEGRKTRNDLMNKLAKELGVDIEAEAKRLEDKKEADENYDPVTEPNPRENPKDVAEREALTAKENPADTTEPTAKEVEINTTKNIIKGLEDQVAKSEKAGRGDTKQAKKQRDALELAKKKLAEMEGKTEETTAEPVSTEESTQQKPASTPEREAKIQEILDTAQEADVANTYTIREVFESQGTDGKWYTGMGGTPAGVKLTSKKRTAGWVLVDRDGRSIGRRFTTSAEARKHIWDGINAKREQFRKSLEESDNARLDDQAKFWQGEKAKLKSRNEGMPSEPAAEQAKPVAETSTEKPKGNFREKKASGEPPKEEGKKRLAMVEGEGVLRLNAEGNVEIVTPEWKVTHNPETGQWESKSIGRESFETLSKKSPIEQTEATQKVAEERALEGERQREEQQARLRQEQADRTENSNWRAEVNANTPKGRKGNIDVQVSRDEGKTFGAESRPATIYGDWAVSGSGNAYEVHHVGTGLRLRGSLTREQANTLVRGLVHGGVEGKFTDNAAGGEANKAKIKDIILATVNGNKPPEYWKGKEAPKALAAEAPKAEPVEAPKSPAVEAAEKQVETINDRLAELERTKKGDSPEADALRAQRDKLQTTIDAQKPDSPDVLSKAEKWADDTIREINRQGRQRSGLDPELLAAYAVKGAVKFARSLKDFKEFSREMVNEFGNGIRPHLKAIFDKAQEPGLAREYAEQQQARNAANRPEPDLAGESEKMAQLRAEERDNNRELAEGRKPVLSAGGRTWRSAIDSPVVAFFKHIGMRMRTIADNNPQSETAQKLVNDFSLIPGTQGTGRDFNNAHSNERTRFLNKFSIALGPVLRDMRKMSAADLVKFNDLFIQALEGRIKVGGETGEAVKRVQEVMDELHAYGKEAGIDMGKVTDYFPRMINAEMVLADRAGFEEAAARAYERQWERLQKEAKDNQSEFGFAEETTQRPNFKEMARKWADAIELNQEGFDFERGIFDEGNAATKENFQKNREFTKEEAAEFDAFRQKDFETVLTNHIGAMARRAEVARRLGADGMEWTKIASKLAEEGVSAKDIAQLKNDIQSNLGIGETLLSEAGQNTQNTYNLVSTTAFLKLTGLLNVAEPGSIGIRERDPVQGAKAMISNLFRIRNVLTRMSPGEAKSVKTEIERIYGKGHDLASALAIELGINHIDHGLGSLSSGFHLDAGTDAGGQIRRVNDNVYRLYGIHATEVAKRETSIKHGMQFIDKSIQFFEGNSNLQRIFRAMGKDVEAQTLAKDRIMELGIKEADVPAFIDFAKTLRGMDSNQQLKAIMSDSPMAAEYRKSLQIFNKQSSVQATRASRQDIANKHPIGKALFQFATYTNEWASQHGRYMLETAKKVRNSDGRYNASERLLAAGVAPAFAMATAGMFGIRHIINKITGFQFEDSEAFGVKVPAWVKSMADAVVYTGILGPAELAYKWIVRDQPPGGLLSSWINSSTKAFAQVKENPDSNAAQKNVAKIGYRGGVVPVTNSGLAVASGAADLIPNPVLKGAVKLGAAGLAQVIANNRTEKAAATAIAGEDNKGTKNPPKPTPPRPPSPPTPR